MSRFVSSPLLLPILVLLCGPLAAPVGTARADDTSELDPVSAECYSCHDGSDGPHAQYSLSSQRGLAYVAAGHLVSASYAKLAAEDKYLNPMNSLPPELVFHEGDMTCVTCHGEDPHLGYPLAMDNSHSDLCRACHLK